MKYVTHIVLTVMVMGLVISSVTSDSYGQEGPIEAPYAARDPVYAQHGMAGTTQPLATQIAIDILQQGGNAVDAAIAANAAQGLMEPSNCGIGGDLFAIVWDPESGRLHGLNASGRSPADLSYRQLKRALKGEETIPPFSHFAVSVPGAVDGWFMLHDRFGSLPMADILRPTIEYARDGFPLAQSHGVLPDDPDEREQVRENFYETYAPGGTELKQGDVFKNPDLAHTYDLIATQGRHAFYEGEIARKIVEFMEEIGGYLRMEDLEGHTGTWVDPVSVNYRGYDVYELPPNGQGIAVLQWLNILEEYDLKSMGHNSADYLHLLIESKKLVYEDRARFYADPEFYDLPLDGLLSKKYAAVRRQLIDMDRAARSVVPGKPASYNGDTVYLTVADKNGMMVSLIESNFYGWGSRLVPDDVGFVLQNRASLFTLERGHPNVYEPGKRPFHTIIPGFVMKDGHPYYSFGVMGGDMQPHGHVQVLCNLIDFGMNVQESGDAARFFHEGNSQPSGPEMEEDGGTVHLERGIDEAVRQELENRGHNVVWGRAFFGRYQGILLDREQQVYRGGTEIRKTGQVAGY